MIRLIVIALDPPRPVLFICGRQYSDFNDFPTQNAYDNSLGGMFSMLFYCEV